MAYLVDQQTDYSHADLFNYLRDADLPDFVKEAELEHWDSYKELTKEAFADPIRKLFTINTKARVYTSNAYYVNKEAEIKETFGEDYADKIKANIEKAASVLGIKEDLDKYDEFVNLQKSAAYEDKSIVFKIAQEDIELFHVKTANDLTHEANRFVSNLGNYPYEWRRDIANEFVKAAEALGVDELPDLVCKYAGQFYPDTNTVKAELSRRKTKLASEKHREIYDKLIEEVDSFADIDSFFKVAYICYHTEKLEGIDKKVKVAKLLGDPVDKLFTLPFSKVANLLDTVTMGGERFNYSDLANVAPEIYEQAFGFGLDPKAADAKDILSTVPSSDVGLFKHLSGIAPVQ